MKYKRILLIISNQLLQTPQVNAVVKVSNIRHLPAYIEGFFSDRSANSKIGKGG